MSYAYLGDLEDFTNKHTPQQPEKQATAESSAPTTSNSTSSSQPPALVEEVESNEYYDKVGNYMISTLCLGSYPCKHTVLDLTTGEKLYLNAVAIYERLHAHGLNHPHFDSYKDYAKIEL